MTLAQFDMLSLEERGRLIAKAMAEIEAGDTSTIQEGKESVKPSVAGSYQVATSTYLVATK